LQCPSKWVDEHYPNQPEWMEKLTKAEGCPKKNVGAALYDEAY